jgi:NADH-quinone oxidoreductase subunit L
MGFLGIIQNDIKRVVAYSTLSQLGYMTVALGVSAYPIAIFHLMTHAFFKALLFLGAGSVIMGMHHDQDIRNMGGLRKYMKITWITSLLGSLALIGTPFFSGFYSKDSIIEAVHASEITGHSFAYFAVVAGVFIQKTPLLKRSPRPHMRVKSVLVLLILRWLRVFLSRRFIRSACISWSFMVKSSG